MAGGHKHKWTKLLKTDYFGKDGFVPVKRIVNRAANFITVTKIAEETGNMVVNLAEKGYDKLLGDGRVDKPYTVVVEKWSSKAEEKLKQVGGKLIKPAELVTA